MNSAPLSAFVTVPETTLPGGQIVPAFEVGRYLCSKGPAGAVIDATLPPWVDITYADARAACGTVGLNLITELQSLAIAFNLASQPCNWISGAVGVGKLRQGLRDWTCAGPGNVEPNDPDQQRWLTLSSGDRLCDVAGGAYTWVFDDVQGDEHGIVAHPIATDSPTITTASAIARVANLPADAGEIAMAALAEWVPTDVVASVPAIESGLGHQPEAGSNWPGFALIRGGCFASGNRSGAFDLGSHWPGAADDRVGFRVTKTTANDDAPKPN